MRVFLGTQEIGNERLKELIGNSERLLKENGVKKGDVVVCRSQTQLGNIIQWRLSQRMNFIPMFTAPDYNLEKSYAYLSRGINSVFDIRNDNSSSFFRLDESVNQRLALPHGSIIQLTSATTGESKMVLRTKESIDAETDRYIEKLGFNENDRFLTIAPFYHSYAFCCVLRVCEKTNADLVLPDVIMPSRVIELTEKMNVNCLYSIPYFLDKMTEVKRKNSLGREMKCVMSTAQRVPRELAERFREKFGCRIMQQYGSTETGCTALSDVLAHDGFMEPLHGVRFETFKNTSGKNQLIIHTDATAGFYITPDDIQSIGDGGYVTNDIARIGENGTVKILGRADRVIIRAGEKLDASYVEKVIGSYPGIKRASVKMNKQNEIVCEYAAAENSDIDLEKLKKHCRTYLLNFQIPMRFIQNELLAASGTNWKEVRFN